MCARNYASQTSPLAALLFGIRAAALVSAFAGLAQYFTATAWLEPWLHQGGPEQVFANLRQRNQLATLLALGIAITLQRLPRLTAVWQRAAAWCMLALLTVTLALTQSRTGLLQLLLLMAAVFWLAPPTSAVRKAAWALPLVYAGAALLMPLLIGQPLGGESNAFVRLGEQSGCQSRLVLWSNVLHLISLKPWGGWGWGELAYAHYLTLYPGERFCGILDNAHNLPLQLAVELGLVATLALCVGAAWWLWRQKPWRSPQAGYARLGWLMLGLLGLHSLVEYPLWYAPFLMSAGLAVALIVSPPGQSGSAALVEQTNTRFSAIAQTSVAIFLIALSALLAYDYHRVSQPYLEPAQRHPAYAGEALAAAQKTWFFTPQARFAELSLTPLSAGNAARQHALALALLHYSPEPRVIERVIESAVYLGRPEVALFHLPRLQAAFPQDYQRWSARTAERAGAGVATAP